MSNNAGFVDLSMMRASSGPWPSFGVEPSSSHDTFLSNPVRSKIYETVTGEDMFGPFTHAGLGAWPWHGSFHFTPVHCIKYNVVPD